MNKYVILANPGHNRVYYKESARLSLAEIGLLLSSFCGDYSLNAVNNNGLIIYEIECGGLSPDAIERLFTLSCCFALFEVKGAAHYPIYPKTKPVFDSSLGSILKYSGKTNELFTRLMINLALYSSDFYNDASIRLFDPVCGKGTTLFEGLQLGMSVYGVDFDAKAVHEAAVFFKKYLENERRKHEYKPIGFSGQNKSFKTTLEHFKITQGKGIMPLEIKMAAADTLHSAEIFPKNSFHLIVGDLPYGISHGNIAGAKKKGSNTRNPVELLEQAVPMWSRLLMAGGVIALSWNSFVLKKEEIAAILERHGISCLNGEIYNGLVHRVDQAIMRDVLLGKKLSEAYTNLHSKK